MSGRARRRFPKRVAANGKGTWPDQTDLVFVDPVGTGYSRPAKPEYGPEFYQTRGDAESVAEFIRVYRNRFEAWDAPPAGVADVLQRRRIAVNGVILIGLALPLGQLTSELRTALMLPTYTAAAFANGKLAPELQSDLQYQGPFGGGYPPPTAFRGDWMSVRWNRNPAEATSGGAGRQGASGGTSAAGTGATPERPLRRAMAANPRLQALSACGYFDLVCSYTANVYLASHLDAEIARNVTARGYGGGHAVYTDKNAQLELKRDVVKFMQSAMPPAPQRRLKTSAPYRER